MSADEENAVESIDMESSWQEQRFVKSDSLSTTLTTYRKDEEMLARLSRSLSRATEFNVRQEEVIDELWLLLYC